MEISERIKLYLNKDKSPPKSEPQITVNAELEELRSAWEDFKYEFKPYVTAAKWLIIGVSLTLNLVSWSIWDSWNGFMGSPEYKQYLVRVSK